jgi:hypothetical protein
MVTFVNRAKVNTATTGSGTITLGSAVVGFQTFGDAGLTNGASVNYTIEDGVAFELGTGVYSSTGPTLTRTLVQSSTGSLLNLTGGAVVFVTALASDLAGITTAAITGGTINGATIGATTPASGAFTTLTSAAGSAGSPAITTTGNTNTGIFFPAADTIAFTEGGAESMRINSTGNVGIGTLFPSAKLDVKTAAGTAAALHLYTGSSAAASTLQFGQTGVVAWNAGITAPNGYFQIGVNGGGTAYRILRSALVVDSHVFVTSGTDRLTINSTGDLILAGSTAQKATGTTWSNPSDQRLKANVTDYPKGIPELMQVRVCEWEYNGKGGTTEGMKGIGVIADEVMTVLPNTVDTYDAKLNEADEEVTAIKKFDATEITWLLVKAVQEQQATILALEARIAALESK